MFIELDSIITSQDKVKKSLEEYHNSKIWGKDEVKRLQLELIEKNWIVVYEHESAEAEKDKDSPEGKKKEKGMVKSIETSWIFNEDMTFVTNKDRDPGTWEIQHLEDVQKYVLILEQNSSDYRS